MQEQTRQVQVSSARREKDRLFGAQRNLQHAGGFARTDGKEDPRVDRRVVNSAGARLRAAGFNPEFQFRIFPRPAELPLPT
jgi:hypothetical protein